MRPGGEIRRAARTEPWMQSKKPLWTRSGVRSTLMPEQTGRAQLRPSSSEAGGGTDQLVPPMARAESD